MAEVLVSKRAEADYAAAYAWRAERSERACRDFESEFERAVDALSISPRQYPKCDDMHRFYSPEAISLPTYISLNQIWERIDRRDWAHQSLAGMVILP